MVSNLDVSCISIEVMSETIFNLSNVITYIHGFVIIFDDIFPLIRRDVIIKCPVHLDGLALLASN